MTLRVKVIPRSPKTEIAGELSDGTIKIRIAAPADQGKANQELCIFLATRFGVAKAAVHILSGHTTTRKLVRIDVPEADHSVPR
jgi:uncharacterized protein (TIGR00251 family)